MASRSGRLSNRAASVSPALGFAALVVAVAVAGGFLAQHVVDDHSRDIERTRDRAQAARLEAAISAAVVRTGAVASDAANGSFAESSTASLGDADVLPQAFVLTRGSEVGRVVSHENDADALGRLASMPAVAAARAAASTDGESHVVAPVTFEGHPAVVVVAPGYPRGTPADITTRRAAMPAVVLGVIRYAALREPAGEPALWAGAPVRITTSQGAIGPSVRHPLLTTEVRAHDTVWHVAVGTGPGSRPRVGIVFVLAGLVAAAAVGFGVRRQARVRERAETQAEVRSRQLQMIASMSASLQQSLELAEILPAFAIDVADEFGLASVAVWVSDDDGALLEIFRFGNAYGGAEEREIDLRRGWRTVGRLVVRPRQSLDAMTTQSLQAVADLLAIAITNAQLYQREQQAVARLSELDALKNAFLGTVSHELRTATTAVQGFGELLTEHWDTMPDERRRDMASRIRRQAGSLRHLVDDLLDYARLEGERLRVVPRSISLAEIVEHVTDSFSPLVSNHRLVVEADPEVEAWVDPIAVERILANLLSNAGKYAPPETTVTVTVTRHGDRARLSVADQGPGIPETERRRVFVRFYRLDNAATIRTHGAGIGLAILHDFASRSGADVTIEDAPGGGALVHVDFPTAPVTVASGDQR